MTNKSIAVVIPTWNARKHLPSCLPPLLASSIRPKILIIDSSSQDGTIECAKRFGVLTEVIPKQQFNHGLTREKARKLLNTDIVVMMTPDAYLGDPNALSKLVEPIRLGHAAVAYGRQIAHPNAPLLESYPREFNYPQSSHLRGIEDLDTYGVYTFFCSNSFAAYSNVALDKIGGFPSTPFGEDTIAVAKLLRNGEKIAYVAEAVARHSHSYTLRQEFQRYYEMGRARKEYQSLFVCKKGVNRRGSAYTLGLMKLLLKKDPFLIPYALCQTLVKWAAFHLGQFKGSPQSHRVHREL